MSGNQSASPMPVRLAPRTIRAPRGSNLSCKGWHQEAAMRMLMNNLDPDVAENPDQLIVYGGARRPAARSGGLAAPHRTLPHLIKYRDFVVLNIEPLRKT